MAKNKNTGAYLMLMFSAVMLGMLGVGAVRTCSSKDKKYIVKYRTDNAIVYVPLSDRNDFHVMELNEYKELQEIQDYKYIKRGDTISGARDEMDMQVSRPVHTNNHGAYAVIWTVNGHPLAELRTIARRDSILKEIKAKQR